MTRDTREMWDSIWAVSDDWSANPDEVLRAQVKGFSPGRALDVGCGAGGNALWLARRGWKVTAIDFSPVAIENARRLAKERGVDIEFAVADAVSYEPRGQYDLITYFYLHLPARERARTLATAAVSLVPGGTVLFVGHDRSNPPPEWTDEERLTLTTPEEVVADLPSLEIVEASVLSHGTKDSHFHTHRSTRARKTHRHPVDSHESRGSSSTVVRATRPRQ